MLYSYFNEFVIFAAGRNGESPFFESSGSLIGMQIDSIEQTIAPLESHTLLSSYSGKLLFLLLLIIVNGWVLGYF